MSETTAQNLTGVAETLLFTLYVRAMEAQRPDALMKDEKAVALVAQLDYDFSRLKQLRMDEDDKTSLILRNREFDRYAQAFLARNPQAVVVHIGCGLDARFDRVADRNCQVEWYDLDLPEVIELRRKLLGGEGPRHHFLACSALDPAWLEAVSAHGPRPYLFLAEGVLMYIEEAQVKALVLRLRDRFPGAELVFDAFSPYLVRMSNLRMALTKMGARYHWGLADGRELEHWGNADKGDSGIRLVDEWGYFDHPEPRLAHVYWMRHIPLFARILRIYHYQLGG